MERRNILRLAIIGVGGVAMYAHLPAYEQSNIKVTALCDKNKSILELLGKKYGIEKLYTDAEEMFENEELDIVDIATPPETHMDLLKLANSYNIKVVMQKPFIVDTNQIISAKQLVNDATMFKLNLSGRYVSAWKKIKSILEEGKLGNPILCNIMNQDWWDRDKNRWDLLVDDYIIFEMLIHHLDLCIFWFGKPKRITARGSINPSQNMKKMNLLTAILEYDNGLIINIVENWGMSEYDFATGHPFENILITCTDGCISANSETVKSSLKTDNIIEVWKYPRPGQQLPSESLRSNWFFDSFGDAMKDYLTITDENRIIEEKQYAIWISELLFKFVEATKSTEWIEI